MCFSFVFIVHLDYLFFVYVLGYMGDVFNVCQSVVYVLACGAVFILSVDTDREEHG